MTQEVPIFSEEHLAQTRHVVPLVGEPYDMKCKCSNDLSNPWTCLVHGTHAASGKLWGVGVVGKLND